MRRPFLLVALAFWLFGSGFALAQPEPAAPPPPSPETLRSLSTLLEDPGLRAWLASQAASSRNAPAVAVTATLAPLSPALLPSDTPIAAADEPAMSALDFESRVARLRHRLAELVDAVPRLPAELAHAGSALTNGMGGTSLTNILLLLGGFCLLGLGFEWLFERFTPGLQRSIAAMPATSPAERGRLALARLGFATGLLAAFALGTLGAFLVLPWPPLLRAILLGYLIALLVTRFSVRLTRVLLAPPRHDFTRGAELRMLPVDDPAARWWQRRIVLLVGWFAFGWATAEVMRVLGISLPVLRLVAYLLGLVLLAIWLDTVWRSPLAERKPAAIAVTVLSVIAMIAWVMGLSGIVILAFGAIGIPAAVILSRSLVLHAFRRAGDETVSAAPSGEAALIERAVRAALIVGGILLMIDLAPRRVMEAFDDGILDHLLQALMILLVADVIWHVARTRIDLALERAVMPANPYAEPEIARRVTRTRTLLPILRNILMIVLGVMTALMVLSSVGVQIAPLIAGAGVLGVAIGFGSQTLVRDIISGMFFLLDDAFRVGEYIVAGAHKGTVEGFSLRSIKLRHHRGPLSTVPFGTLGAVQNLSRDWVIDKVSIRVPYDTDIEKARKLVKKIGQEFAADPEFGPDILEPMKMQGVEEFAEFGIVLRIKMKTRPGRQFTIRRKSYARMKQVFEENGIRFAVPTVNVGGDDDRAERGAAAAKALSAQQAAQATAAAGG